MAAPSSPRHYDIRRNDDIINFFNDFSDHLAEEALWELSLKIKPRNITRRKTDRRKDLGAAAAGEENAQERRRAAPRLKGLWTCAVAVARAGPCRARQASAARGRLRPAQEQTPSHGGATGSSHSRAVTRRCGFGWGSSFAPSSALPVSPPRAREPQSTWSAD